MAWRILFDLWMNADGLRSGAGVVTTTHRRCRFLLDHDRSMQPAGPKRPATSVKLLTTLFAIVAPSSCARNATCRGFPTTVALNLGELFSKVGQFLRLRTPRCNSCCSAHNALLRMGRGPRHRV